MTIFSDKKLPQKIERSEARSNAVFVESHAKLFPSSGAQWIEVAAKTWKYAERSNPCSHLKSLPMNFSKISPETVKRDWSFAKTWLLRELVK